MTQKSITIDEKTKITVGFFLVLIGGIYWITSLFFEVKANSREINSMKEDQKDEVKILQDIHVRVIRIEEKIKK